MFCRNCGKEVTDGAKFCWNCGAAVDSQPMSAAEPPKAPPPTAQQEVSTVEQAETSIGYRAGNSSSSEGGTQKKNTSRPFLIGAVTLALLLVVGFVAVPKLLGGGPEPDSNSEKESNTISSDLSEVGTEPTYSQYTGTWAAADIGWVYGGQILDIAVNDENMTIDFSEIQPAPASRVASVSQTIPVSEIQNGVVTVPFDNDDWGHSGTMNLTFTEEAIICEIKDIKESSGDGGNWGVVEGKFLLVRNSAAHEAMDYSPEEYNQMFPDSDSEPQSAESNWIERIPYLPGYADLFYFEDWGVRAHERPHEFEAGGVEEFIGLSDSAQVSYSTTDIDGGTVCFGKGPEWTVSYAEVADEPLKGIGNYYQIIYEQEPLIGKRDDGYCFLFYKRDYDNGGVDSYCYEIYMVQQTDSPDYKDWLFRAYIYVNAPEFYDYLNGTKQLEIISAPVQGVQ